jgi:acyl-CoA thioester hydrolase
MGTVIILHTSRVRVYYEDTDAGGIVYYANYLRFFERARTEWLRALGVEQGRLRATDGIGFVVRDCAMQYLHPARLDDEIDVTVGIEAIDRDVRRASMRFVQRATRVFDATTLVSGTVRVACVLHASGRPAPIPDWLLDRMRTLPAGSTT